MERGWGGAGRWRAIERPRSGALRKPRTAVPIGDKLALIDIKDAGHMWEQTLSMLRRKISLSADREIYEKREGYKRRAAESEDLSSPRLRLSYF